MPVCHGLGQQVRLDDVVDAMHDKDVVLLGETHDDLVAHHLQLELLRNAHSQMSRRVHLHADAVERPRGVCMGVSRAYLEADGYEQENCVQDRPLDNTLLGDV